LSLALARRIKERFPHIQTVLGGASVRQPMGIEHLRAWPWVDHVCTGEGDQAFPELVQRLRAKDLGDGVKGFLSRVEGRIVDPGPAPMVVDMDALPAPDYGEYLERVAGLGTAGREYFVGKDLALPIELARGCWWGARHKCKFCGVPGEFVAFRSRSSENARDLVSRLSHKYGYRLFVTVEDILDPKYVKDLFGYFGEEAYDYKFWCTTKSGLGPEQLLTLRNGGVEYIGPGVESLSSHILRLLGKGVTALANVNMLKWARYNQMAVAWNLLKGVPGETTQDYLQMLQLSKRIVHLCPPNTVQRAMPVRFSAYFEEAHLYGLSNLRPNAFYAYIYPPNSCDLENIAYFFDCEIDNAAAQK